MGNLTEMECTVCDFKIITDGYDRFYVDYNTGELVEFMFLRLTEIDDNNEMYGHIKKTYCPNCDKIIKTYMITESKYSEEESINKLEKIIKKSDVNEAHNIDMLIGFQEHDEYIRKSFGDEGEEKIINNDFFERFRENENILPIVQFENYLGTADFKTVEEYCEHEKNMRCGKIICPQCGEQLYREFQAKKCPICDNELAFGYMLDID